MSLGLSTIYTSLSYIFRPSLAVSSHSILSGEQTLQTSVSAKPSRKQTEHTYETLNQGLFTRRGGAGGPIRGPWCGGQRAKRTEPPGPKQRAAAAGGAAQHSGASQREGENPAPDGWKRPGDRD